MNAVSVVCSPPLLEALGHFPVSWRHEPTIAAALQERTSTGKNMDVGIGPIVLRCCDPEIHKGSGTQSSAGRLFNVCCASAN
jgi:hypothetical protein